MSKSSIVIIIYIIGLIFGALVLDIWSAETSPKSLLGIGWTALFLIGLFFAKNKPIKNNAVQPIPSNDFGLVSALQMSNTRAPKIRPII